MLRSMEGLLPSPLPRIASGFLPLACIQFITVMIGRIMSKLVLWEKEAPSYSS